MNSRIEEPGSNLQRMSNQKLSCPVCGRGVNYHTELESVTCVNVAKDRPTQHSTQASISGCFRCLEQETAIRQLWSIIQNREHPTCLSWRCTSCNQERKLSIT